MRSATNNSTGAWTVEWHGRPPGAPTLSCLACHVPKIFVYQLPYAMKGLLIDIRSAINNSTGAWTVEWHGRPPGAPTLSCLACHVPKIFVYQLPYAMKGLLIDMRSAINNSTGAWTVEWHGRPPGAPTLSCLACHVPSTESEIFVYRLPYAKKGLLIDMRSAIKNSTGARTVEWHGRPPGAPTLSCLACHVPSTESVPPPSSMGRPIPMHLRLKGFLHTPEAHHEADSLQFQQFYKPPKTTDQVLVGKFATLVQTTKDGVLLSCY
ncbi:hypothetical protein J6590_099243 [Homalodisca vitripennis]|nr:hypothetical protein J6590_099243 [Homalodisca vitripennis]